jgi:hypothetical protein
VVLLSCSASGACALGGDEEPGCRDDAECGGDFVCRAGACFRVTTGLLPPQDPAAGDAGDAGDAGLDDQG